ncbi:MAG: hypothetical protein CM1200mP1_04400 [Candidatus Neomarinimicrobiota bacterium]|nr:MAG: hypothetical protein CM1200mP1_04400 [Candidatus Neomarinimicrobiota bacterium]
MRYSYQREAIKKVVKGTNFHPTADWIYNQTKKIISQKICLGTVYRNLKQLSKDGEIKQFMMVILHGTIGISNLMII